MTLVNIRTSEGEIVQVESEVAEISIFKREMHDNLNIDTKSSTVSRLLDCLCYHIHTYIPYIPISLLGFRRNTIARIFCCNFEKGV